MHVGKNGIIVKNKVIIGYSTNRDGQFQARYMKELIKSSGLSNKKGEIENINLVPGQTYDISLPPDYEVQYHTHPDRGESPPTPEDIMALLGNNRQQAEMVFKNGEAFIIVKTRKSKELMKLSRGQIQRKLEKVFLGSRFKGDWETEYKKQLEELGFIVYINKNLKKKMDVQIKPKEPKRRKK